MNLYLRLYYTLIIIHITHIIFNMALEGYVFILLSNSPPYGRWCCTPLILVIGRYR